MQQEEEEPPQEETAGGSSMDNKPLISGVESERTTVSNWADLKSARKAAQDTNPWDDTPHRNRPPALRGLLVRHKHWREEPPYTTGWQNDEIVYNKKLDMWSEYDGHFAYLYETALDARNEYLPERMLLREQKRTAYMDRWHAKYEG